MNKQTSLSKRFCSVLLAVLIAATALFVTACFEKETPQTTPSDTTTTTTADAVTTTTTAAGPTELGKGEISFFFNVTDKEGNVTEFIVKTDELTVGTALTNLNLIDGEEGPYGLYVKTVNGMTLDAEKDGYYWSFYVDGAYGMNGVDTTEVEAGKTYEFKAQKA